MSSFAESGIIAESTVVRSHDGLNIETYFARPISREQVGSVVVLHHLPGYDEATKEIVRKLASHGYAAACPNLYHRESPGMDADQAAEAAKGRGGVPDDQVVNDCAASARMLRALPYTNDKVAVMGFCSGGRQAFIAASSPEVTQIDAVVNCYGALTGSWPAEHPLASSAEVIDQVADLSAPMLGLFGKEDVRPSTADVEAAREALSREGKTFEFHSFDGAGHAFFSVDRAAYRPAAATEGWRLVWNWLATYLE